jgi:hypothetical protein
MKLYQKKWWKTLFKEPINNKQDSVKDIQAVIEFLEEVNNDVKILLPDLKKLCNLEKERKVAASGVVHINIDTQAKLLDKILERYEFFQNDADITGIRIQKISEGLLENAKKKGMEDLVEEKNKTWNFF